MTLLIVLAFLFGSWVWRHAKVRPPSDHEKNGWWKDGS